MWTFQISSNHAIKHNIGKRIVQHSRLEFSERYYRTKMYELYIELKDQFDEKCILAT